GAGSLDMCLVKFNSEGIKQWNYTWGGSENDYGYGVALDSSGNIYVSGGTSSFGAVNYDLCLVKFNFEGIKQWNYTWGGNGDDLGYMMTLDSSGDTYLAGNTKSFGVGNWDTFLVKFSSEGIRLWNYTWGGIGVDFGWGITLDSSGNAYVAGYTNSFGVGHSDMCLVKFNSEGIKQWNYTWGGSEGDYGRGVALDSSGNAYVAGYTYSFGAVNSDMCLVKFNSEGIKQWNYTWGGIGYDFGIGITLNSSGNAYVTGYTTSFGAGNSDIFLMKFEPDISGDGPQFPIFIPILIGVSCAGVLAAVVIFIYLRRKRAGGLAGKETKLFENSKNDTNLNRLSAI
ncbi:MAG: SBBP repeat-containing protein, partial [Candidatus Hodarchaeota archaeon]